MKQIESLLRHTIGLHAATIGSSLVEHAVRGRMRRLGLTQQHDYLELLRKSPAEWNLLVESMVVTETWFFREKQPFTAMVRLALEEWLPAHPAGLLRLLSVPCSSGEEPYSMAMALMDAGFPATRFDINAVDISARALAFAQRGIYGRNSFRGQELDFRARFFQPVPRGYTLNPAVRKQVRFQKGNMLDDGCLPETGVYDFIFCRNLLIYFDRPAQNRTLAKLRRLLTPTGVLFVGSAEQQLALHNGFVSANLPLSFACRKAPVAGRPVPAVSRPNKSTTWPVKARTVPQLISPAPAAPPPPSTLGQARQLANEGRLAEAAELCETHLRESGVSAEAYYLLGQVRHAAGADAQAGEFYRKALYLEPGHSETLQQWALLSERNGNLEHARILRERAGRRSRQPDKSNDLWIR
jgi:chemotaxis protein methyltransferase WspC